MFKEYKKWKVSLLILLSVFFVTYSVNAFPVIIDSEDLKMCVLEKELQSFGASQSGLPKWRSFGGRSGVKLVEDSDQALIGLSASTTFAALEVHGSSSPSIWTDDGIFASSTSQFENVLVYVGVTTTNAAITDIASQCLETDANGNIVGSGGICAASSGLAAWEELFTNAITPTSTIAGIFVNASSTFDSTLSVNATTTFPVGDVIIGQATTTIKDSALLVMPFESDEHGIIIQGLTGQSEHLFMVRDATERILVAIASDGDVIIDHIAEVSGEDALHIDNDINNRPDITALSVTQILRGLQSEESSLGISITANTLNSAANSSFGGYNCFSLGTGLANLDCLGTGVGFNVIHQDSGVPANADNVFLASSTFSTFTDITSAANSAGTDVSMFVSDNEYFVIGSATKFGEISFDLDTEASKSIFQTDATFEHSATGNTFAAFSPIDTTNGMQESGIVRYDVEDIDDDWVVSTVNGVSNKFWIRWQRTRNNVSTVPIENLIQISVVTEFDWNKDGNLNVLSVTTTGHLIVGTTVPPQELAVGELYIGNNATTTGTLSVTELEISDNNFTDLVGDATISFNAGTLRVVDLNCTNCIGATEIADLDVASGGTGASSLTDGGILLGSGTGAITVLGVATNGQIPIGDGATDPVLATLTATANETEITNGAGSITIGLPDAVTIGTLTLTNPLGEAGAWEVTDTNTLSPTSTSNGILVNASSTFIGTVTLGGSESIVGDASGNLDIGVSLRHIGDTDTRIDLRDDQIDIVIGGNTFLTLDETTQDVTIFNDGQGDIDLTMRSLGDASLFHSDGLNSVITIGSTSNLGKLGIDGNADEIQLLIQSHSTQTNSPFVIENSAGTDLITADNTGILQTGIGIDHLGDSNTGISFGTDSMILRAGGEQFITTLELSQDVIIFNNLNNDIDFQIDGNTSNQVFFINGFTENIDIHNGTDFGDFHLVLQEAGDALTGTDVDISELAFQIRQDSNTNTNGVGLGFSISTTDTNMGAAIIHERVSSNSQGGLHFATKGVNTASADIPIRMSINDDGNVGIGEVSPESLLELSTVTTVGIQVLTLDQNDADQPFIDYQGTVAANGTATISSLTTSGATTHHIQVEINGVEAWIAVSTNDPT